MPRVTLVQLPACFGEVDAQLRRVRAAVAPGSTDLLVLPEAALTGYVSADQDFDLAPFAEPLSAGVARLASLAATLGCDVVGPVIERDGARCFNAVAGVGADGKPWLHYRKRHPWYPETWATAGDTPWPLVQWRGLWVTCAVCFDVHFVADEAARELEQADLLLFPSAWVEEEDSRPQRLAELATRFNLAVVNPNWGPGVPRVLGQGRSLVAWPDGRVVEVQARGVGTGVLQVDVPEV